MKQTWRWFGPGDLVSIDDISQAGAEGIVSALHHIPSGALWTADDIARRQADISHFKEGSASGLAWDVVESLPVSEDIKKQKGDWREHIAHYKQSLRNIAAAGIEVLCYNFMPVLDWTRTDLAWRLPHGGTCMRFDYVDFAVFDIHILKRPGAEADFPADVMAEAKQRFAAMSDETCDRLAKNVAFGLPGAAEKLTLDDVRLHLSEYDAISKAQLRSHYIAFLEEVIPVAESLGIRMCCHPDDPPFGLLGLPRVMSTESDYRTILDAVDSPSNGITLCSGSLGVRPDNDLPGMMQRLGGKVHFLHLRNVKRESAAIQGSFYEAEHLGGDTDMVALIAEVLREEARRQKAGRGDHQIPMRPDHGQDILDDLTRRTQPGYPSIGRLKGLAELRGVRRCTFPFDSRIEFMTRVPRLDALQDVVSGVQLPGYAPQTHGAGIVHLGIGAFHRAHQAVYTDDALADGGGDWRIIGVSLRGTDVADALNAQNGLYTLLERSEAGTHARIIASVARVIAATRDRAGVMKALIDPATRIVSMTVTEKAYGIQRDTGRVDLAHPAIAHDFADPQNPIGVIGFLCEGLRLRRAEGLPPFTVLCCDNLPENGKMVRACMVDFAKRVDADLGDWIASQVAFPSTMVDRITPASTEKTLLDVARMVGAEDQAAIETEPFIQW